MKKLIFLIITACILTGCTYFSNYDQKFIKIEAQTPEEAVFAMSDELFKTNTFDDMSISDKELLKYTQLNKYENLTTEGTIYSYELIYKLKTDDEKIFIDNKVTGELVETNVWLDNAVADRCIVLYENNGRYYMILSWDSTELTNDYNINFRYLNDGYGGSNSSEKDWLECNIIKRIFENVYNIPNLELSPNATSDSLLRKLIRDIEMNNEPDYVIDKAKSRIYDMTYDDELKCIYFKADLYTRDDKTVVKDTGFSLFMNGGFSIYEVGENNKSVPKYLD